LIRRKNGVITGGEGVWISSGAAECRTKEEDCGTTRKATKEETEKSTGKRTAEGGMVGTQSSMRLPAVGQVPQGRNREGYQKKKKKTDGSDGWQSGARIATVSLRVR